MSKIDFEKIAERFCDGYCKFPQLCSGQEELEEKCAACPINCLEKLIDELEE